MISIYKKALPAKKVLTHNIFLSILYATQETIVNSPTIIPTLYIQEQSDTL